jgi:hypothetical protein
MAAALLLAALLGQAAGRELRKQEYESGTVSDQMLADTNDEIKSLKESDAEYFSDQKSAFNTLISGGETELRDKARVMLANHTASSFKANTDMELVKAEFDRIKPLVKTTQYNLKAWLKTALKQYKQEEKTGNRDLAQTEKAFSKWMTDSERGFGRYLKDEQKDASKDADKYIKKLEAFGKRGEKDLKGLDKTFFKDKDKIDKVNEQIVRDSSIRANYRPVIGLLTNS